MALDRSRVLETAQKHLAKGQYDKAIAEYQKLVREDPNDVRTWLKIGDLYTRKGARKEACDTYGRVARTYAEQGFFLKAVAVYKQILKLDPSRLDVQLALAEMYEHLQLVSDALTTYEQVAAAYARKGDIDRALSTLGRMADLDPDNIPVRIKYAEALSKAGKTDDAAEAFERGAELLKAQGRYDDYIKVAERLLYHRPSDIAVAKELAQLYLERNDAKRALGKLQLCFKADPRDVGTLEMLAHAFHLLGQVPKTVSVYREVARIHQESGDQRARADVLRRILELDPDDQEARQALAAMSQPSRASAAARAPIEPPPSAVIESQADVAPASPDDEPEIEMLDADEAEILDDDQLIPLEDEEEPAAAQAEPQADEEEEILIVEEEPSIEVEEPVSASAGPPPPDLSRSIPPEVAQEAHIARLLTECDVFQRYGLKDKVVAQLTKVLEVDPNHVEARERLKDALLEQGRNDEAIEQLYALADLLEHDSPQLSVLYLKQILEVDPASEPALSRVQSGPTAPSTVERPIESIDEDEVLFVDEDEGTIDEGAPTGAMPEALPEAPPVEARHAQAPPAPDEPVEASLEPPARVDAGLRPMSPEEFEAAPLRPSTPGEIEAARVRASMPPGEVEEVLDEAEFFLAQQMYDAAREALQDALSTHPDHPLILDKLNEISEISGEPAIPASGSTPGVADAADVESISDDSFLLAEKLAEELGEEPTQEGSDMLDVESVFAQFKKGVEEQIGLEDSDTHFDLGIAYKEMGLLDDAVHEFDLAKSNPQRECIAYTMMGLCFIEKGDIADAIAHFKKGLYADAKTEREELGLYFELGQAYELLHDPKEAIYYYQKVQKRDASFRGVGEKIKQLTAPQAPKQEEDAPKMEMDDVDRAFDDLMGED